jgi:hypothetical protein
MSEAGRFSVEILQWEEVHRLPDDWEPPSLRALLELAEIEGVADIGDADLLDMVIMALQDLELEQACDLTLRAVFGDRLSAGVRQNLIDDLQDDRPWEQVADPSRQSGVFTGIVLLQQAFPTRFGKPDAAHVSVRVTPKNAEAKESSRKAPDAAMVLRLLAGGMPNTAVLRRLYSDALGARSFPNARSIVWRLQVDQGEAMTIDVHSSLQWLGSLEDAQDYETAAWPDA